MSLYHKDVYMPVFVKEIPLRVYGLNWSNHARLKAIERFIFQSGCISFDGEDIVEAEIIDGTVSKVVVRLPFVKSKQDVCYVLRPDIRLRGLVVITVWINDCEDNHSTLDISKYERE